MSVYKKKKSTTFQQIDCLKQYGFFVHGTNDQQMTKLFSGQLSASSHNPTPKSARRLIAMSMYQRLSRRDGQVIPLTSSFMMKH